jgi:hypothetical protein
VKAVRDAAKRLQHGLVGPLGPVKGNIGRRAAADLNRWPATIYWNGLRSLGILQRPFSEGRYYSHLVRHSSQTWTSEDGILHEEGGHCWDERCPNVPLSRPSKKSTNGRRLTFELTRREAEYLRRRFETVNGYNESLMKCRLEAEADHDPKDPWDVRASGVLGRRLRHAERLSSIGMGLLLVYTHRMHRVRRESEQSDEVWNCYLEWQETAKRSLRTWDVAQFRSLLLASGFTKARSDTDFLEHVRDVVCGPKGRSLQPISDVVQARELTRRSAKCRLCGHPDHRRYLKQWRAPKELSGAYVFPYRHHIGTTVVREIREGLQRRV